MGDDERLIRTYQISSILHYLSPVINPHSNQPSEQNYPADTEQLMRMVLLRSQDELFALEVDQVIGEQKLVIRPLGPMIVPPPYVHGSSILADGRLTLVIDGAVLVIALSTVKSHTNSIFGKLQVTSRREAIVRARELQLL